MICISRQSATELRSTTATTKLGIESTKQTFQLNPVRSSVLFSTLEIVQIFTHIIFYSKTEFSFASLKLGNT